MNAERTRELRELGGKRTYDVEWVVKASHAIPELLDEVELANKLLGAETITDANSVITSMWAERSHMNEQINKLQAEVERLKANLERLSHDYHREIAAHGTLKHKVAQHKSWGKQLY